MGFEYIVMKIFAFSDWRVHSLDRLAELIDYHKPDVVLYAGDDLDRFIPEVNSIVLKTPHHSVPLSLPEFEPSSLAEKAVLSKKARRLLPKLELQFNNILNMLEIPFHLVNGNDDCLITINGSYYTRLCGGYYSYGINEYQMAEDSRGKVTLSESDWFLRAFHTESEDIVLIEDEILDEMLPTDSGIYAQISPSFGKFTLSRGRERVSVIGVECRYGLQNKIIKPPEEYADIYLSHLPPIGCLDLSSRFGTEHIGSKRLLAAIKKYKPKLVICGHSHMWGGNTTKIGGTIVINVSSHDNIGSAGNYALVDTTDWSIQMMSDEPSKLHKLPGMTTLRRKSIELKNTKKLKGLYKGSESDLVESLDYLDMFGINTELVRERLKSLKWKKPKIKRSIYLDPYHQAFVDVETGLAQGNIPGKLWLVGIWYDDELRQFLFPKQKRALIKYIRDKDITSLASWTRYDANALRPIFEKVRLPMYFLDACQKTRNCVIWHTYSLHSLYDALFESASSEGIIEGFVAGLYADHLILDDIECPYCPSPHEVMETIKVRNRVDILQMVEICTKLWEI